MTDTATDFFSAISSKRDQPSEMISAMIDHFRQTRQPAELFEALKMSVRHRVGLPLIAAEHEESRPEDIERQLESGLIDGCREAGTMLLEDGKVREGWMYLRPTGDLPLARRLFADIPIDDDNYDDMVQVLVHEGVDVGRGFQAVLDHQGTCNSITLYEQALVQRGKSDRRAAASRLLEHFHGELTELVRGEIARREAPAGDGETLAEMLEKRAWILGEGGYHLDTTHLAATVRIASVLDRPEQWRKAWELTQYGRRLNRQFQYPGEEPFVDFYPAYAAFYATLLGEQVDAGLRLFERRARAVDPVQHGTAAIETYVDLLDRLGRARQAVEAAIELIPDDVPSQRIVPLLLEIASREKAEGADVEDSAYGPILDFSRRREDVLGYVAALHARRRAFGGGA